MYCSPMIENLVAGAGAVAYLIESAK